MSPGSEDESLDDLWLTDDPGPGGTEAPPDAGRNPGAESFSEISAQLEGEKDARREERFVFCLIILILLDVIFFMSMSNWSGPIVIGALEALLMVIAAKRWGLDEIAVIIDSFVSRFAGKGGRSIEK